MPAIPAIIYAGGAIGSAAIAHHAAKKASQPSKEEAGYLAKQGELSDLLKKESEESYSTGMPRIQQAMGYYDALARGDRGKMQSVLAPSIAQITDQYRGAEDSVNYSSVRGGSRDLAKSQLLRDKASKLALLTTGQQPAAWDALNSTGMGLLSASQGGSATAGSILSGMTGNAAARRMYGAQVGAQTGSDLGGILADVMKNSKGKKWGGGGGNPPTGGMWSGPDYGGSIDAGGGFGSGTANA